jgi:hypothetical protein
MVYIDPATGQETGSSVIKKQNDKQLNRAAKQAAGSAALADVSKRFSQRFDAMRQSRDFSYIFAKDEATQKKVLVKVRKDDGTELDKILFENMRPIYEVDFATQSVYYIFENELRIFNNKI